MEEIGDIPQFRYMVAAELEYFEQRREEIGTCISEQTRSATTNEQNQMFDLDLRLGISIGVLRQVLEEEYVLDSGCAGCALDLLEVMQREWFRYDDFVESGEVGGSVKK